jgi:hypothetical protein
MKNHREPKSGCEKRSALFFIAIEKTRGATLHMKRRDPNPGTFNAFWARELV